MATAAASCSPSGSCSTCLTVSRRSFVICLIYHGWTGHQSLVVTGLVPAITKKEALSSLFSQRLEADLQPMPGRLGEAGERAGRGLAASAFQPRDGALRRLHALGEL